MPDIKEWLCAAAGTLASGQVVMPISLSMQEAMYALEIMDPAMDWGMRFDPHGKFDPGANLAPEKLCWVMDEMAARELAWHKGGTLAQTVFSSLHYHNTVNIQPGVPEGHEDYLATYASCAALRAYVLAYAKCVEVAFFELLDSGNGTARDGEDLWLDAYGIPINTTEGVGEVLIYVDNVIKWLQTQGFTGEWWDQVVLRLQFRKIWLRALQLQPAYRLPSGKMSDAKVAWAFDDVMPFLRQNMPLPTLTFPSHAETWEALQDAIHQIRYASELARLPLDQLEQELLCLPTMLPVVRTLFKVGVVESRDRDESVDRWLSRATGKESGILDRIDGEIEDPMDRRSFALWRDIVSGNLQLNLSVWLFNPSRRRRGLQHLARAWSEQAEAAIRLQHKGYANFGPIITALQARALDCELEAALLAFSLRLVAKGEHRAQWWWVLTISLLRVRLQVYGWESAWASVWVAVASAMVLLYTVIPLGTDEPTMPRFLLRHKIPINGSHVSRPLPSKWEAARKALDEAIHDPKSLSKAQEWLQDAADRLEAAAVSTRIDTRLLARDIAHTLDLLSSATPSELSWDAEGPIAERRVPRLRKE